MVRALVSFTALAIFVLSSTDPFRQATFAAATTQLECAAATTTFVTNSSTGEAWVITPVKPTLGF